MSLYTAPVILKSVSKDGAFSGYASVFDVIDATQERIRPGAFRHSLNQWKKKGRYPDMLWQHTPACCVGAWDHIQEDHYGLWVQGQLMLSVPKAREVYTYMKTGAVQGLSVGFRPIQHGRDAHTKRTYYQVDLVEISLVVCPANPQARVVHL